MFFTYNRKINKTPKIILHDCTLLINGMDSELLEEYEEKLESICIDYLPKLKKFNYFKSGNTLIHTQNYFICTYIQIVLTEIEDKIKEKT